MHKIISPLTQELVAKERKTIAQELRRSKHIRDIIDALYSIFYKKNLRLNKNMNTSFQEIAAYKEKYYQPENWIICDDSYRVVSDTYVFDEMNNADSVFLEKSRIWVKP